jgi:hypothetical protein
VEKNLSTNTDETSEITGIFTNAFNSQMNVSTLITESAQYIDIQPLDILQGMKFNNLFGNFYFKLFKID